MNIKNETLIDTYLDNPDMTLTLTEQEKGNMKIGNVTIKLNKFILYSYAKKLGAWYL